MTRKQNSRTVDRNKLISPAHGVMKFKCGNFIYNLCFSKGPFPQTVFSMNLKSLSDTGRCTRCAEAIANSLVFGRGCFGAQCPCIAHFFLDFFFDLDEVKPASKNDKSSFFFFFS